MKQTIVIITFVFCNMFCRAQVTNELTALLSLSIEKHLSSKEQLVKEGVLIRSYLDKIVFLKDNFPSDFSFVSKDGYKVSFFDESQYRKSELRKGVRTFRVSSIVLNNDLLKVTIVDGILSKRGGNITLTGGESSTYQYTYRCDKKRWEAL
ncbi:hypothetical protein FXV77_10475 [Sphingobacterium phlebotomi]|uniref:Uncharacterized protein n=1 Tax=Sphingobacterium phlebotomi TaxID=2605433 RepID=A0A5D4H716_9SPHI|nr:hypothetical protein [Sphingobacterium phlebotomi]TYR36324.1 hypothetical protein FXV77_10475 [Sphingobacterium phlebotomi]